MLSDVSVCAAHYVALLAIAVARLPERITEISGPINFFSKFQDIFVGFTRLKTQKMYVFLCSQILISQVAHNL